STGLEEVLDRQADARWVQLVWAGIEPFAHMLDDCRLWTSGKGIYAQHVAEHALTLTLAGLRGMGEILPAYDWSAPRGSNLFGQNVVIVGGGAVAQSLWELLAPFGCNTTVARRKSDPVKRASRTIATSPLEDALPSADVVVLALALTPTTAGI